MRNRGGTGAPPWYGSAEIVIRRVHIQGFKSLADVSLDLGRLNVIIGSNGSGKTNLLEAIGLIGCAASGRVDDEAFKARGVRPGTPALYKTALKAAKRIRRTITLEAESEGALYRVSLDNPLQDRGEWKLTSETLLEGEHEFGTRSPRGGKIRGADGRPQAVKPEQTRGIAPLVRSIHGAGKLTRLLDELDGFAIYTPFTPMLRGTMPDPAQKHPLGLQGGGLADAVGSANPVRKASLRISKESAGLIDWAAGIWWRSVGKRPPTLSSSVPQGEFVLGLKDRYMVPSRSLISAYDASEGALYVLFLMTLALHRDTPRVAAVDNVDQALNPRLARGLIARIQDILLDEPERPQLFLTTHNPLVLDALKLKDDRVRLFVVDRSRVGATTVRRIEHSDALVKAKKQGKTLSQLWLSGMLGGMPNL
jgi:energy-coupling factor transporter ATP-binding protein EcfA2